MPILVYRSCCVLGTLFRDSQLATQSYMPRYLQTINITYSFHLILMLILLNEHIPSIYSLWLNQFVKCENRSYISCITTWLFLFCWMICWHQLNNTNDCLNFASWPLHAKQLPESTCYLCYPTRPILNSCSHIFSPVFYNSTERLHE
jgi:hypothetical protein